MVWFQLRKRPPNTSKRPNNCSKKYKTYYIFIQYIIIIFNLFFSVSYLCLKKMRLNIHGGLDNYEIENSAKLYVDLTKWKFEFIQAVPLINS